jgi:2-methylcitrate dehydratase PrpD
MVGSRATESLSERLTEFALGWPEQALPDDLFRWAAYRCVDTVGVALASARENVGTSGARSIMEAPAPGKSSIWGSGGQKVRVDDAVFANSMIAHGMDFDDTHTSATMHPSCVLVPTTLGIGEELGISGKPVLAAAILGYEVSARLCLLAPGEFQRRGFHPTSVLGIFGAVAAASRLYGLSHKETVSAMGIAGSMASGLMEYLSDGSNTKQMHPGWAARGAVTAVRLARQGCTGPATVLEGDSGVYHAFIGAGIDVDKALDGLGEEWAGTRVATKPYPACHCVHAPVDAWFALRRRLGLKQVDIDKIKRFTGLIPEWYLQLVGDPIEAKRQPRSVYEARFSLPYSLSVAVLDDELTLASYQHERLSDASVLAMCKRVDYEVTDYEEFPSAFPGGIRVEMEDGTRYEEHVRNNKGSVGNPMSEHEIDAKFRSCLALEVPDAEVEELLDGLKSLPESGSLGRFTSAMAAVEMGIGNDRSH